MLHRRLNRRNGVTIAANPVRRWLVTSCAGKLSDQCRVPCPASGPGGPPMIDTRLYRWLRPLLRRRRRGLRAPEEFRPRGTSSKISRLSTRYDAEVDAALGRLWPKARVYHDREFTRDRADFLLVVRGRGVMIETKVKSDPGLFRGSTLPPLLDRLQRDGRRLVVLLNQ